MYELTIEGSGFLWHQIRCIMSILLLVGQGKEHPDVILQLLDVKQNPSKPQYSIAKQLPLNLFHTYFESVSPVWNSNDNDLGETIKILQQQWTEHAVK